MWIDERRVLHTVALPDPTQLMTAQFQRSFDAIAFSRREDVQQVIDEAQETIFDADWTASADEHLYVAVAPPVEILHGDVQRPEDVRRAIQHVSERWRLDAVLALDDYIG